MIVSVCRTCEHCKEVVSGKGSRFMLCQLSQSDRQYPKYPPQPVIRCAGHVQVNDTLINERANRDEPPIARFING